MDQYYRFEYAHQRVCIDYTNWKGERAKRIVLPLSIFWGASQWHPKPQWLMYAFDYGRDDVRHFALSSIHNWEEA
jgi:predicted DNA-binding transcriptional regulator YafY